MVYDRENIHCPEIVKKGEKIIKKLKQPPFHERTGHTLYPSLHNITYPVLRKDRLS